MLTAENPRKVIESLQRRGLVNDRKLRLFLVACCRPVSRYLDGTGVHALQVAEKFADAAAKEGELLTANEAARWSYAAACEEANEGNYQGTRGVQMGRVVSASEAAAAIASMDLDTALETIFDSSSFAFDGARERRRQLQLLHCVLGNLTRRVSLDPACRAARVTALAKSIYKSRDFSKMKSLAADLEQAGCDDDDVLLHCRRRGEHARGCWVLDLILGKK